MNLMRTSLLSRCFGSRSAAALGLTLALGTPGASVHAAKQERKERPVPIVLLPADGASVRQNPPDFRWPYAGPDQRYVLQLTGPGGVDRRLQTSTNSTSWPEALPSGSYQWQVSVTGRDPKPIATGQFRIPPDASTFVVPPADELLRRVAAKERPRWRLAPLDASAGAEAREALRSLSGGRGFATEPSAIEDRMAGADQEAFKKAKRSVKQEGQRTAATLLGLAVGVHRSGGDATLRSATRTALLEVSSWEADGASGIEGVPLVARDLLVAIAAAYDAVHADLTDNERKRVRDAIVARVTDFRTRFVTNGTLARTPYNSHGWVLWGAAAASLALVAGEGDAIADQYFTELVPTFITSISPWGGDDGGYANGVAYGSWDITAMIPSLDVLGSVTGVDVYRKPWLTGFGRFLTYFLPPGAPEAPFADGAELLNATKRSRATAYTFRALAQRIGDPLLTWRAAAEASGDAPADVRALLAPGALRDPGRLPPVPQSWVVPSIGWAAMHSDLSDPKRVSVYFVSSPYGSIGHSHASQNAFVLHARGQPLLRSSGYYDSYGTPHHKGWYQTTKAHNAITYDGGKGQPVGDVAARGTIAYASLGEVADVVTGDASAAYGSEVTRAVRHVVFLKPDIVLVRDSLAADVPRRWEWNFHALEQVQGDDKSARVSVGDASVCIDRLQGPSTRFEQSSGFRPPPRAGIKGLKVVDHWNAAFVSSQPVREAEFLFALRVGCRSPLPRIEADGAAGLEVSVGTRVVGFPRDGNPFVR